MSIPEDGSWPRDEHGGPLPIPPPEGYRPPNGCMWGHDPSEFCYIRRRPGVDGKRTIWTRSMIRDFGECYDQELECEYFYNPEIDPQPRLRRPWPVLKVSSSKSLESKKIVYDPPLGHIDEGCDHDNDYPWDAVLKDSDDSDDEDPEDVSGERLAPKDKDLDSSTSVSQDVDSGGLHFEVVKELAPWVPYSLLYTSWWNSIDKILATTSTEPQRLRFVVKRSPRLPSAKLTRTQLGSVSYCGGLKEARITELAEAIARIPIPSSRVLHQQPDLYDLEGIPILQEHIPKVHFPDNLLVHDPYDLSMGAIDEIPPLALSQDTVPILYERLWPPPEPVIDAETKRNIAQLYITPENEAGAGHHSVVYATPLQLPSPLTTFNSASVRPGTVRVMAKVAIQDHFARQLLDNEGEIYNSFPRHLSDEYCGLHLLTPEMTTLVPSAAIVPKFFGYYIPIEGKDTPDTPLWKRRSPILLIEDCGRPISTSEMCHEERYVVGPLHIWPRCF